MKYRETDTPEDTHFLREPSATCVCRPGTCGFPSVALVSQTPPRDGGRGQHLPTRDPARDSTRGLRAVPTLPVPPPPASVHADRRIACRRLRPAPRFRLVIIRNNAVRRITISDGRSVRRDIAKNVDHDTALRVCIARYTGISGANEVPCMHPVA